MKKATVIIAKEPIALTSFVSGNKYKKKIIIVSQERIRWVLFLWHNTSYGVKFSAIWFMGLL